jgi:hypothetical protein
MKNWIWLLWGMVLVGCGAPTGIVAVTPLPPLESLEIAAVDTLSTATPAPTLAAVAEAEAGLDAAVAANIAPLATPTPLTIRLAEGAAVATMIAIDAEMQPTPRGEYVQVEEETPRLYFWEMFDGYDPETGLILSDKLVSLDGQRVTMQGFMAPPLQLDLSWFQLTLTPLGACPFCSSAETVLPDMVTVYPIKESTIYTWQGVQVTGRMEVGPASDPETGMYSLVRIYADEVIIGVSD